MGPRRTASSGEDVADREGPAQEGRHPRRRERGRGVEKGPCTYQTPSGPTAIIRRINVSRADLEAAWSKRSNEGRDYLFFKLDDPSFTAPIFANLVR